MNSKKWGPPAWRFLHAAAKTKHGIQKQTLTSIVRDIPTVLPCRYCRAHSKKYFTSHGFDDKLRRPRCDVHNMLSTFHRDVNRRLAEQKKKGGGREGRSLSKKGVTKTKRMARDSKHTCPRRDGSKFLLSVALNYPVHSATPHKQRVIKRFINNSCDVMGVDPVVTGPITTRGGLVRACERRLPLTKGDARLVKSWRVRKKKKGGPKKV